MLFVVFIIFIVAYDPETRRMPRKEFRVKKLPFFRPILGNYREESFYPVVSGPSFVLVPCFLLCYVMSCFIVSCPASLPLPPPLLSRYSFSVSSSGYFSFLPRNTAGLRSLPWIVTNFFDLAFAFRPSSPSSNRRPSHQPLSRRLRVLVA